MIGHWSWMLLEEEELRARTHAHTDTHTHCQNHTQLCWVFFILFQPCCARALTEVDWFGHKSTRRMILYTCPFITVAMVYTQLQRHCLQPLIYIMQMYTQNHTELGKGGKPLGALHIRGVREGSKKGGGVEEGREAYRNNNVRNHFTIIC